jgi:hypothetical protein
MNLKDDVKEVAIEPAKCIPMDVRLVLRFEASTLRLADLREKLSIAEREHEGLRAKLLGPVPAEMTSRERGKRKLGRLRGSIVKIRRKQSENAFSATSPRQTRRRSLRS